MSGITNSDRNYWINFLEKKISEKIDALKKEHEDFIVKITASVINDVFKEAAISQKDIATLSSKHAELEQLQRQVKSVEKEIQVMVDRMREDLELSDHKLHFYYNTGSLKAIQNAIESAKSAQIRKLIEGNIPELVVLQNSYDRIRERIMLATTANNLKEVLAQLFKEFGITVE